MKVGTIHSFSKYPKSDINIHPMSKLRASAHGNSKTESNNKNQINTTIKRNSDGRASFKGGTPLLHTIATFTKDNPLLAEAMFAILITCGLRPLTIMATAKNDEEKEKCSYQAAKSISSGLVGLAVTTIVATPIAMATKAMAKKGSFEMTPEMKEKSLEAVNKGINALKDFAQRCTQEATNSELVEQIAKLTENGILNLQIFAQKGKNTQAQFLNEISQKAPEILESVTNAIDEQKVITNYAKTNKNIIDKLFQPIVLPLRAKITIAMVPVLLGLLGKKKPTGNPQTIINQTLQDIFQTDKERELFGCFSRMVKNEN